ncbi:DNA-directed RNA polymerase beta chain, putative (apicoplast) [Theileria equi strain WA]|uniref:DNA-directed RNA polymerase subunit beta n=1 Tax=Theileria equi strain WA TaxID=1537102 RepID=L1L9M4_THEEQ|nr:DNA-directed RNA polymerase beta chain, putative [Theileria equi strain WA]EKX71964.1 DNA-directed RNA polymerase beta chain, putative [Theileria equi strain WA]|eukprot:XP_025033557.1 DNA-directed RNA polymerase beta chain, putative (apicoplast) [Theileria equi strain WA]
MYNSFFLSPSVFSYFDYFFNNLDLLFKRTISFIRGGREKVYNKGVKFTPYINHVSVKFNSEDVDDSFNYYLDKNFTSCYVVCVPLKFSFNSVKEFYVNYNILNIPKISPSGEVILKGYNRVSILYVKSSVKCVSFVFCGVEAKRYIIKFQSDVWFSCVLDGFGFLRFCIYSTSYKGFDGVVGGFSRFFYFLGLNCSCGDVAFLSSLCFDEDKFSYFFRYSRDFYLRSFLFDFVSVEVVNVFSRLLNVGYLNKLSLGGDGVSTKYVNSLTDIVFGLVRYSFSFRRFIRYFRFLLDCYESEEESFSVVLFKENLLVNPVLHYANQLNTLSCIHDKFKINVFGYSSSSSNSFIVSPSFRGVKSEYFGFINMLYTSDGETCGLLSLITSGVVLCDFKLRAYSSVSGLSSESLAFSLDVFSRALVNVGVKEFNFRKVKGSLSRFKGYETYFNGRFKDGNVSFEGSGFGVTSGLSSVLSITELVIPFLFNDDPCRGLMGSKMHMQALPLVYSSVPYVFTKYNQVTDAISSRCVYSSCVGVVVEVTSYSVSVQDEQDRFVDYHFSPFNISDYDSYSCYTPIVREGERVDIGQILAVPRDVENLEYSVGFNNVVNYGMYYGYEHEDAVIVNKSLLFDDVLTSVSFDVYEMYLSIDHFKYVELTLPRLRKYNRWFVKAKRASGFFSKVRYVFEDYVLMSKIRYEVSSFEGKRRVKLVRKVFYKNRKLCTSRYYVKVKTGGEGRIVQSCVLSYNRFRQLDSGFTARNFVYLYIRFFVSKVDRVNVGDKVCGRHGNKGVISKIVDAVDMPYTSFDLCPSSVTSPIGALARMNVGQFLEGHCGYNGGLLGCRVKAPVNVKQSCLFSFISLFSDRLWGSFYGGLVNGSECVLKDFKTGYRLKSYAHLALSYCLKLMHTSKSKHQYRSVGRYSFVTQQPVQGRSNKGSQRFGEMEVWALEAHGVSYNLREMAYVKTNYKAFISFGSFGGCSEIFKSLVLELKNVLIDIRVSEVSKFSPGFFTNV